MEGESQGLSYQSTSWAERVSERLARFQANVEGARQEIEDLYERYIGLGVPLTGEDFEKQVLAVVRGLGFVAERTKPTADGGIDIVARRAEPLLRGKYIIQCKNWTKPVGARVVRELYGVVMDERASKGTLITTSRFTQPALEFAAGKPLELIDGDGWRELVLGTPVASVEEVREGSDDPMAYLALVRLISQKSQWFIEGLKQALYAMPGVKEGELEDEVLSRRFTPTVSELDNYLSGWESWLQGCVSAMKELIIARPPADYRELYGEMVGCFHGASVAVFRQLSAIAMKDEDVVLRLELDASALFGPVIEGGNRLLALAEEKVDEFDVWVEQEEEN